MNLEELERLTSYYYVLMIDLIEYYVVVISLLNLNKGNPSNFEAKCPPSRINDKRKRQNCGILKFCLIFLNPCLDMPKLKVKNIISYIINRLNN